MWHYMWATWDRILCSCFIQMALAHDKNGFSNIWKHFSSHQTEKPEVSECSKKRRRRRRTKKIKCRLFRLWIYWLADSDKRAVEAYHKTSIYSIKCLARSVAASLLQRFDAKIFNHCSSPWESFLKGKEPNLKKEANQQQIERTRKKGTEHEQTTKSKCTHSYYAMESMFVSTNMFLYPSAWWCRIKMIACTVRCDTTNTFLPS